MLPLWAAVAEVEYTGIVQIIEKALRISVTAEVIEIGDYFQKFVEAVTHIGPIPFLFGQFEILHSPA
jgi:hypothetical protein